MPKEPPYKNRFLHRLSAKSKHSLLVCSILSRIKLFDLKYNNSVWELSYKGHVIDTFDVGILYKLYLKNLQNQSQSDGTREV